MIIERLKETRERLDLKQKDIGKLLGVNNSTVSGWETGKDTIPLTKLIMYANEMKYSLDYLFGICEKNYYYSSIEINKIVIGKNLKQMRIMNNLTQKDIANKLNTTQSTISNYESGNNLINTTFLCNLTHIYKPFSIDKLFDRNLK